MDTAGDTLAKKALETFCDSWVAKLKVDTIADTLATHWPRCKAEALVDSLRHKPEQNMSGHMVTHWAR